MDWDGAGQVFSSDQQLHPGGPGGAGGAGGADGKLQTTMKKAKEMFREFVRTFRVGNTFPYREQLIQRYRKREFMLEVQLSDLANYEPVLHDLVQEEPNKYLELFEHGARDALKNLLHRDLLADAGEKLEPVQITVTSDQAPTPMRGIEASDVNRLLQVSGIVISATRTRAKALKIVCKCSNCGHYLSLPCTNGVSGATLPRQCTRAAEQEGEAQCPLDPYVIVPDKSQYVDQQTLKLQESPEVVPTGEMPRTLMLSLDRNLVDMVSPGTRVDVVGVSSIFSGGGGGRGRGGGAVSKSIRMPYLRVIGIKRTTEGSGRAQTTFTPEEEEQFVALARDPRLYERLWRSINPAISGQFSLSLSLSLSSLFASFRSSL